MSKEGLVLAFDFETIANPFLVELLPEVKQKANLKDPEKIKADIEEKKIKQLDMMGCNPHLNIICCASFRDVYSGDICSFMLESGTLDEKPLLEEIWDFMAGYQIYTSFNGMQFDVECLKFHSMTHEIAREKIFFIGQNKYLVDNHVDIRMVLGQKNDYAKGTQDMFSRVILGEEAVGSGSEVQEWWDNGDHDKIQEHCEHDVDHLARIYRKIEGYYGF